MIGRLLCGLAVFLGCHASVFPAAAAGYCAPLKMMASVKLVTQPGYLHFVPVTINGSPKQFMLDTGGSATQVASNLVKELHLQTRSGATELFNVSRTASGNYVKLDSFSLGDMTTNDVYLRVSPSELPADGLIAIDVLNRYDVELDFAGGKMNYFFHDHCPGKVIYWPHEGVARVPIWLADRQWIKVPVKLDGKSFMAIIDTGASGTFITTDTAKDSFGLTPSSPGMEPAGNVNGDPNLASYGHIFSSFTLGDISIKNLRVTIVPDKLTNEKKRLESPEVTLGMNVLKHLHLYFAFNEGYMYATAADAPALPAGQATSDDKSAKTISTLSPPVLAALREAQGAFDQKNYPAALAGILKAKALGELQPFELLVINRLAMAAHAGMRDMTAAAVDAEAAADTDPSVIPDNDKASVYKMALQLSLIALHYDKAAKYARLYQATNPPASDDGLIKAGLFRGGKSGAESDAPPPK